MTHPLYERIMNFLVHTQLLIAFGAIGVTIASSKLLEVPLSLEVAFMVFSTSFVIYNINRRTDHQEDKLNTPNRIRYVKKYELVLYISIVMYLTAIAFSMFVNIYLTGMLLLFIVIGMVYSYAMLPNFMKRATGYNRLKQIPLIKNFVVSLVWAFIPLMVSIHAHLELTIIVLFVISFVFIRLFIGCMAFDVRDVHGDSVSGIRTLPYIIGIKKSLILLHTLNIISGIFMFSLVFFGYLPTIGHFINLITLYGFYYIRKLGGPTKSLINLCDRVIDGEYVVLGALALVGNMIF